MISIEDLITVVIPVYNVEEYLEKCVDSVLKQTYSNIEIILVDDGSKDSSGKLCDEYEKRDKRIKVIHKNNGGLSSARNAGIDIAEGKYICFIDSDDFVTYDYVEYLYKLIKKFNVDLSICNRRVVWKNTKTDDDLKDNYLEEKMSAEKAFENLLFAEGIDVCAYAKMYEMSLWDNIRYPVGEVYEDSATTYKLIEKAKEIAYGDKECYFYIARGGSISKNKTFNEKEEDYIKNTNAMLKFIYEKYPNLEVGLKRFYLYSNFRILRMLMYNNPRLKDREKFCLDEINKYKKEVLKEKRTPRRDKFAIIILNFGVIFYKAFWSLYCRVTGRI